MYWKFLGSKGGIDCIGSWMESGQSELFEENKFRTEYWFPTNDVTSHVGIMCPCTCVCTEVVSRGIFCLIMPCMCPISLCF